MENVGEGSKTQDQCAVAPRTLTLRFAICSVLLSCKLSGAGNHTMVLLVDDQSKKQRILKVSVPTGLRTHGALHACMDHTSILRSPSQCLGILSRRARG